MALEPLGRRPEVLRTYQVMERNNLYREKVQLGQVIEHIDKLTKAIEDMDKKVEGLSKQAGVLDGPLVYAAFAPYTREKSTLSYAREQLLETVGKTANASHEELLSTLNAPPITFWVKIVQAALHDAEQEMKISSDVLKGGKDEFQDKLKDTLKDMGSAFERLGKDVDKLLEDIPHLARVRDRGWSSMRVIIEERRQQSPPHRGRPEPELEL